MPDISNRQSEPFHLTHIEVGDEENLPNAFFARFTQCRAAVQAEYPYMPSPVCDHPPKYL
ncbi:hypothetical protein ACWCQS_42175 [Streptomyces sp. NPDC002076]